MADAATTLYGQGPSTGQTTAPSIHQVDQDTANIARTLYPQNRLPRMPRDVVEDDDRPLSEKTGEEIANTLYRSTDPLIAHAGAARIISNVAVQDFLNDPIQAEQVAAEWADTFASYKLDALESTMLTKLGVDNIKNPPTQEMQEEWTAASLADLQRDWGADKAGQALQDARMYVARTRGAAELIDRLGSATTRLLLPCAPPVAVQCAPAERDEGHRDEHSTPRPRRRRRQRASVPLPGERHGRLELQLHLRQGPLALCKRRTPWW